MTDKAIVNLINILREQGINDTKIIDTICYIELADPHTENIPKAIADRVKKSEN